MTLKITSREVDGVNVVNLEGRIVRGEESDAVREQVKSLLSAGERKIVLNMALITFIDSAGTGDAGDGASERAFAGRRAQALQRG